jgi:hypothetical protein
MGKDTAHTLLTELLNSPAKFSKQGKTYSLLQEYFKGFDLETLRPLLHSEDPYVQSAATFIASELGKNASSLIEDLIPLLKSDNLSIKYEALESIMLCSLESKAENFVYILKALNDKNDTIRHRAMELASNATEKQIKGALQVFGAKRDKNSNINVHCLSLLLKGEGNQPKDVVEMLNSKFSLTRKYGVMLSKRLFHVFPNLIKEATVSNDIDIQKFSREFISNDAM